MITQLIRFAVDEVKAPSKEQLNLTVVKADDNLVQSILGLLFGAFGAIAVVVILVAAINIAKSYGNPEEISKAKKTIIYALVGLVVAISAEAIVYFVMGNI